MIKVSKNPNMNWRNDAIQFPRLIEEAQAAGLFNESALFALSTSMDLTVGDVAELIDRAQKAWDSIKAKIL